MKPRNMTRSLVLPLILLVATACGGPQAQLAPTQAVTETPPAKEPTATPAPQTPTIQVSTSTSYGLTIEEYAIVADEVMAPYRFEFFDYMPEEILTRREAWRGYAAARRVDALNETLAPFGYRLEAKENSQWKRTFFDLYIGEELLLPGLSHVWPVSVNESGTDFALTVENAPDVVPLYLVIHNGRVEPVDWTRFVRGVTPVYLGDDLLVVESLENPQYEIKRNDEAIYTYTPGQPVAGSHPVVRLVAWEGHWVMETFNGTIMDGESLEKQLGVDETFHYILLRDAPLFFFEERGKVRISYDGKTLPLTYEEVVHHQCCEPSVFNVKSNEHMLWFYGLRDGIWYYVEIGVYDA